MSWWQRILALIVIMAGLVWGFYWIMGRQAELRNQEIDFQELQRHTNEQGEVMLSGRLRWVEGTYFLEEEEGKRILLKSNRIKLNNFTDESVKITGDIEGSSVVVRKIEILK